MSAIEAAVAPGERAAPSRLQHIVLASVLGTTVEWYDFLIYGTGAALVFNKLFFPNLDPLVGTLAAFGSYAVGFVARPLGGAIIGHLGDRRGRKAMLTLTMIIMGGRDIHDRTSADLRPGRDFGSNSSCAPAADAGGGSRR